MMESVAAIPRFFARTFFNQCWAKLSAPVHIAISKAYARVFEMKISRYFIRPYCWFNYRNSKHYESFKPGNGKRVYETFQDFFTRDLKEKLAIESSVAWPCEGHLCDRSEVASAPVVNVKGDRRHIRTIFGKSGESIPDSYHFSNVFLHNNNYHHIHAPVTGEVKSIERIPGDLIFLRPWAYKQDPSLPAFRNERVNVELMDDENRPWYLSIVGGPGVATIKLLEKTQVGSRLNVGEKMGGFLLGSTCCVASPVKPQAQIDSQVKVGQDF